MRGQKEAVERKADILNSAERLFLTKGYQQTTMIDILTDVGIAKGTFYYYFESKEEVLDAIIHRIVEKDVITAKQVAGDPHLSVLDQFFQIFFRQKPTTGSKKEEFMKEFHHPHNIEMQQKSLVKSIQYLSPILADVVRDGIKQGVFHLEHPQETIELLITAGQILFDQTWFDWSKDEALSRANAFTAMMELSLGAPKGSFDRMLDILL